MNRIAGWRLWLGSLIMGTRPVVARSRFGAIPASTPWWKRQWYRLRPPPWQPPPPMSQERLRRWQRWVAAPDDEVGVGVPLQAVLAEGESAAVVLTYCVAYSTGFQIGVGIRHRREPERPAFANPRAMRVPYEPPEMSLVLSVRFADGKESTRGGGRRGLPGEVMSYLESAAGVEEPPAPEGPVVMSASGGGGGRRWDWNYWVWPLPPEGPVTITCQWPAGGIPEASVDIDGTAVRRAGGQSQKLWSD